MENRDTKSLDQITSPIQTPISSVSPVVPILRPKNHVVVSIFAGVVILAIGIGIGLMLGKYSPKQISSYEDCMKAKESSSQESNPPTCVTSNGLRFKGPVSSPTPTPDPTANWKTYTNSRANFSFRYPNDAQITEEPTSTETTIKINHEKYVFVVSLTAQTPELNIENIAKQKHEQVFTDCRKTNKKFDGTPIGDDELTFPKITAKQFSVAYCPTEYRFIYLFLHGGFLFTIERSFNVVYSNPADPKNIYNLGVGDTITDQILSTFKFWGATSNKPIVTSPVANSRISSPLTITGMVPAGWMFEGVFPITLVDDSRKLIFRGQGDEKVSGSWTEDKPINFAATITFTTTAKSGFILLEKDNPSGKPELSEYFEIPINF